MLPKSHFTDLENQNPLSPPLEAEGRARARARNGLASAAAAARTTEEGRWVGSCCSPCRSRSSSLR
uniref:Uncharacterized protein n=1 Tax=Oryza meridionalis TaxID=40149 RepID=A0A0E0FC19_9ORYZ